MFSCLASKILGILRRGKSFAIQFLIIVDPPHMESESEMLRINSIPRVQFVQRKLGNSFAILL